MIEKILERLEELYDRNDRQKKTAYDEQDWEKFDLFMHRNEGVYFATKIVQEVAKDGGWIPCSERLPNDYEFVYATCISLVDNRKPWVIECVYYRELGGFETASPMIAWGDAKVIAWMPRKYPAPYQKGE